MAYYAIWRVGWRITPIGGFDGVLRHLAGWMAYYAILHSKEEKSAFYL